MSKTVVRWLLRRLWQGILHSQPAGALLIPPSSVIISFRSDGEKLRHYYLHQLAEVCLRDLRPVPMSSSCHSKAAAAATAAAAGAAAL